jgi:hypothetical protein
MSIAQLACLGVSNLPQTVNLNAELDLTFEKKRACPTCLSEPT